MTHRQTQPDVGLVCHVGHAWVCHDQLCTAFLGFDHMLGHQWMAFPRVRANDENNIGRFPDFGNVIGHCPTTQSHRQTGDGGGVSETGAVIDVIRADHRAGKLLSDIVFFIGCPCRRKQGKGIRA